jgi:hypothetical protein
VLGPGPPPCEFDEIYRFLPFFIDLGAFNRAGKNVTKVGIYALPPLGRSQKVEIFDKKRFLTIFI